jgi:hypothetical protein
MNRDDYLVWTLPALLVALFLCLWWESDHEKSDFRLVHFVTGPEGRGSSASLCLVVGLVAGVWLVWWFAVHNTLTEWMMSAFNWFCGGVGAAKIGSNALSFVGNKVMPVSNAGDAPKVSKGDNV